METDKVYKLHTENIAKYKELFAIYEDVYGQTEKVNDRLNVYRM
ncbi:hypothetical protein [Oceanobacillus picturae]|nr:hypothetical protein [Oceanobacillus picturae]